MVTKITVEEIETIRVIIKNKKEKIIKTSIYEVLYISQCSKNLLLEDQLNKQGIEITTVNKKKFFKKNKKLVAIAI